MNQHRPHQKKQNHDTQLSSHPHHPGHASTTQSSYTVTSKLIYKTTDGIAFRLPKLPTSYHPTQSIRIINIVTSRAWNHSTQHSRDTSRSNASILPSIHASTLPLNPNITPKPYLIHTSNVERRTSNFELPISPLTSHINLTVYLNLISQRNATQQKRLASLRPRHRSAARRGRYCKGIS